MKLLGGEQGLAPSVAQESCMCSVQLLSVSAPGILAATTPTFSPPEDLKVLKDLIQIKIAANGGKIGAFPHGNSAFP